MLAVTGAYFVCMWTRMDGATVGMRVMKLSVRDQATGGPITQGQAITRWLFLGAPCALEFFYGWAIGFIVSLLVLVYYIYLLVHDRQEPDPPGPARQAGQDGRRQGRRVARSHRQDQKDPVRCGGVFSYADARTAVRGDGDFHEISTAVVDLWTESRDVPEIRG